jgi:carbohydrate diacid regulator
MVILDFLDAQGPGQDVQARAQKRLRSLSTLLAEEGGDAHTLTMGIALTGIGGAAISCQSARTAARIGRARQPRQSRFSYYDQALPVLLSGLGSGWQAAQLKLPLARLQAQDKGKQLLRRTLEAWFAHDGHPAATAEALHIHRNTLDYRLRRVGEITGLDLGRLEDRLLLYVSALLTDG